MESETIVTSDDESASITSESTATLKSEITVPSGDASTTTESDPTTTLPSTYGDNIRTPEDNGKTIFFLAKTIRRHGNLS